MNTIATNLASHVILPSLVVTGLLYVIHRLLSGFLDDQTISGKWTALITIGIGIYFLGHPLYPALVPLIRSSTSWLFGVGGAYITLGLISFIFLKYNRFFPVGSWLVAIPVIVVAILTTYGFEFRSIIRLFDSNWFNFEHSLYLSIPLALMFSFGYDSYLDRRNRLVLALFLVFIAYALTLATSFPLVERVRGPAGVMFTAFGCLGVLLGIPSYVLGNALASPTNK